MARLLGTDLDRLRGRENGTTLCFTIALRQRACPTSRCNKSYWLGAFYSVATRQQCCLFICSGKAYRPSILNAHHLHAFTA